MIDKKTPLKLSEFTVGDIFHEEPHADDTCAVHQSGVLGVQAPRVREGFFDSFPIITEQTEHEIFFLCIGQVFITRDFVEETVAQAVPDHLNHALFGDGCFWTSFSCNQIFERRSFLKSESFDEETRGMSSGQTFGQGACVVDRRHVINCPSHLRVWVDLDLQS